MNTPTPRHRGRWWKVIAYEVWMLREMVGIPANHPIRRDLRFNNSVNENALLRIRNLCDFSTSTHSNDIKPEDLFDNYATDLKYKRLNQLVRRLDKKHWKGGQGSVRWAFNKKLAHPTKVRSASFKYARYVERVLQTLKDVIAEMERVKGRSFESLL
jgi:hypothetical protein